MRTRAKAKGKAVALPMLPLAQDPEVVVQLSSSQGPCWQSRFTTAASNNDESKFKAKQ